MVFVSIISFWYPDIYYLFAWLYSEYFLKNTFLWLKIGTLLNFCLKLIGPGTIA